MAPGPTFPFGAHVAVVEVDTDTGEGPARASRRLRRRGTVLDPLLFDGQVHGGIAQGVAQALVEEFAYDDDGNPVTGNFADYTFISAAELPDFEVVHQETPTPFNPLGAKGVGESGTIGSTPAVQSAVVDALAPFGVRHVDMPCTPRARVARRSKEQMHERERESGPDYTGKVAFVTGAGSGIGARDRAGLRGRGASVVAADIDQDAVDGTVKEIEAAGGVATAVRCDVTKGADLEHAVAVAVDTYGGLDAAFDNAGVEGSVAAAADVDEDEFDRVTTLNVKGVWLSMKHEVPAMIARGGGAIVNASSVWGCAARPGARSTARRSTRSPGSPSAPRSTTPRPGSGSTPPRRG